MAFVIEDGIPLPRVRAEYTKYPFGKLRVGQSFVSNELKRARSAAHSYSKQHGVKFVTRVLDDGKSIRIWRVA